MPNHEAEQVEKSAVEQGKDVERRLFQPQLRDRPIKYLENRTACLRQPHFCLRERAHFGSRAGMERNHRHEEHAEQDSEHEQRADSDSEEVFERSGKLHSSILTLIRRSINQKWAT